MSVVQLSAESFQAEVLQSDQLVFVDFYADWCGPCKMIAPIVDQLSGEFEAVKFTKLNVDQAQDIAANYGIASIPTMLLFKNGEKVDQAVGALPKAQLQEFVQKNL